jgi:hypothetical protein
VERQDGASRPSARTTSGEPVGEPDRFDVLIPAATCTLSGAGTLLVGPLWIACGCCA